MRAWLPMLDARKLLANAIDCSIYMRHRHMHCVRSCAPVSRVMPSYKWGEWGCVRGAATDCRDPAKLHALLPRLVTFVFFFSCLLEAAVRFCSFHARSTCSE